MNEIVPQDDNSQPSDDQSSTNNKWIRGALNAAGGAIPFVGGMLSAAAGVWGEKEQEKAMEALRAWLQMLHDELREKQRTMVDMLTRLDMHDEEISKRIKSDEYQSLLKKAFRNWAGTESRKKQDYVRNILTNAAATRVVSDDVISLFIDWLHDYSEFHFAVIGELYRSRSATRGEIWDNLGKGDVREDSAEADLFKLLIRDLSTGGIIRQHKETDYHGNFLKKQPSRQQGRPASTSRIAKSAFDDTESYELTALGQQFVHYAMSELTIKLAYNPTARPDTAEAGDGGTPHQNEG
jgi:hypothetical protein